MFKFFLGFFCTSLFGAPSIVFIHLGDGIPSHLPIAIKQARLFTKDCAIYLIANRQSLENVPEELVENKAICVAAESLPKEANHASFQRMSRLDRNSMGGFWMFATERFFYLFELMKRFDLSDVFHLEYDNMLYADVAAWLPTLHEYYSGKIAATFDNDSRCIGGFMYISDRKPLEQFTQYVAERAHLPKNDMEFLAAFKNVEGGAYIDHLPIIAPSYAGDHPLVSANRHTVCRPELYFQHFDAFQAIFDAAAIGQYLGGISPRNGPAIPGFINESSVFNPSLLQYEWIADEEGRLVPMAIYRKERWPIVNLHIHSKNLAQFYSRRNES